MTVALLRGFLAVAILVCPFWCRAGMCCAEGAVATVTGASDPVSRQKTCPHCRTTAPDSSQAPAAPIVPQAPDRSSPCICSGAVISTVEATEFGPDRVVVIRPAATDDSAAVLQGRGRCCTQPLPVRTTPGRLLCYLYGAMLC